MVDRNDYGERLAALENEFKNHTDMLTRIDKKIDKQDYVPRNEIDERFEAQGKDVHGIKVTNRWAWGIAISSMIGLIAIGLTILKLILG
ncbi:hypothetical protein GCM10028778_08020 [Barrientosiimonas marina]|uniref:Holin n=1 Tax=Lentibacillus kimchii TaxID=1542911 RepID=A0ABW2UYA3_9BACI